MGIVDIGFVCFLFWIYHLTFNRAAKEDKKKNGNG